MDHVARCVLPLTTSVYCSLHVEKIQLSELPVESHDPKLVILLKTITSPYIYSATVTVAEDESGNVTRLTICNLEDSPIDPIISAHCIIAIKQPSWSRLVDGGYHVQVDHPSDIVILKPHEHLVPAIWRQSQHIDTTKDATKWKKDGDMMFLKKQFRKALEWYG